MSNNKCLGFIETFGLAACVAAADAAVKSANVKLLGYEYAKGGGMCTVKVEGNVGACRAAIAAGKKAAEAVNGSLSGTKSTLLKARPADGMRELLVDNRETVGGEIALAEGYRPKGDTKKRSFFHWSLFYRSFLSRFFCFRFLYRSFLFDLFRFRFL